MTEKRENRILWFAHPGKILHPKYLCTKGVHLNPKRAENFFKLWIDWRDLCVNPLNLCITG
jgi:hypothetical protein